MPTIGVLGLGYVGLPLAVEFGKHYRTIGFDISEAKINSIRNSIDPADELKSEAIKSSEHLQVTADPLVLAIADFIVVAVPTPVNSARQPDFAPLISASEIVGRVLRPGTTVVYESTVYPGATEEVCIPVLEKSSGLCWKRDFYVGYSPERINPGDKVHTLTSVVKVVAGDSEETLNLVASTYEKIVKAGVHRVGSIKVAEASKVIENTQRDLNIALMNELALIFDRLGIDTLEVLKAAGTKWNFLPFRPGLVGGHCIGVDPYYLTYKAEQLGYHPEVILAGRRINDNMGKFIAQETIKQMVKGGFAVNGALVIVLGLTFKEDVPDLRNSRVIDVIKELESYGAEVKVHDPMAKSDEALHEYGVELADWKDLKQSSAMILAVNHAFYCSKGLKVLTQKLVPGGVFVDVKSVFETEELNLLGFTSWRL